MGKNMTVGLQNFHSVPGPIMGREMHHLPVPTFSQWQGDVRRSVASELRTERGPDGQSLPDGRGRNIGWAVEYGHLPYRAGVWLGLKRQDLGTWREK